MKGTIIRELNERERAVMEKRLAIPLSPFRSLRELNVFLTVLLFLAVGAFFLIGGEMGVTVSVILLLVSMYFAANNIKKVFSFNKHFPDVMRKHREAVAENKVEVAQFTASAVIVESEDVVIIMRLYFDVGDNHVLRVDFSEPDLGERLEYDYSDIWISNTFEIVRTVKHSIWVGYFNYGNNLEPVLSIDTVKDPPLECKCEFPVAMFEGSLDNIEETLKKEPIEVWG
jgi:hypothetical protein